jgi:hypothetical protein
MPFEITLQSLPYDKRKLWRKAVDFGATALPIPTPFNLTFGPFNIEGYSTIYVLINFFSILALNESIPLDFQVEESYDQATWVRTHRYQCGPPVISRFPFQNYFPGTQPPTNRDTIAGINNSFFFRPRRTNMRYICISNSPANYQTFFRLTSTLIP